MIMFEIKQCASTDKKKEEAFLKGLKEGISKMSLILQPQVFGQGGPRLRGQISSMIGS